MVAKRISAVIIMIVVFYFTDLFAQSSFSTLQCDTELQQNGKVLMNGKLFVKGQKVRMELGSADMGDTITFSNGTSAYVYIPSQKIAMTMPISEAQKQLPLPQNFKDSYKLTGREQVDGKECEVYEYRDEKGNASKIWLDAQLQFPRKTIAGGVAMYYKNIVTGSEISDDYFELPAGIKTENLAPALEAYTKGGNKENDY